MMELKTHIGEVSMEMIVTIFKSLGVDQTVFIQFITLIVVFIILSHMLFDRLQAVLELREGKTTKLEGSAHAIYKKAEELTEQYKAHVEKTHQESQIKANSKKNEIMTLERSKIKETEDKLAAEYEEKKKVILNDYKTTREKSLTEVEGLAKNLVDKLTK